MKLGSDTRPQPGFKFRTLITVLAAIGTFSIAVNYIYKERDMYIKFITIEKIPYLN